MNKTVELERQPLSEATEDLPPAQTHSVEPYISPEYARAERDKLWRKVWLQGGCVEEIPEGRQLSYLSKRSSMTRLLIVRFGARHHQGFLQRLLPSRASFGRHAPRRSPRTRASKLKFVCSFHAWTYNLEGQCTYIMDKENWQGALNDQRTRLGGVKVRHVGRMDLDQPRPEERVPARLSRARGVDARAVRAAEHALPMAPLDRVRLQLESRHGGVRRDLPRAGDSSGIHAFRQLRRLGETARQAQPHRLHAPRDSMRTRPSFA